jgi:hypothetical protein
MTSRIRFARTCNPDEGDKFDDTVLEEADASTKR